MQTNIMAFRGLIHAKYKNESAMARALDWPRQRLNRITTGAREPNVRELNAMAQALDTGVADIIQFFLPDGHQTSNKSTA